MSTSNPFDEIYEKHKKEIQKVNEALIRPDLIRIENVYMDLNVIKDTRMGLMMALSSPEEREYLKDNIHWYNRRLTRHFVDTYPKFKYSEEALQKAYEDPRFSGPAFLCAPDTTIASQLYLSTAAWIDRNTRLGSTLPITLTINIWPLSFNEPLLIFADALSKYLDPEKVKVNFIKTHPFKISEDFWIKQNYILLDDIELITNVKHQMYKPLFIDRRMVDTVLIAFPIIAEDILQKRIDEGLDITNEEQLDALFELTLVYFEFCCHPQFVRWEIPLPEEKKAPEQQAEQQAPTNQP